MNDFQHEQNKSIPIVTINTTMNASQDLQVLIGRIETGDIPQCVELLAILSTFTISL